MMQKRKNAQIRRKIGVFSFLMVFSVLLAACTPQQTESAVGNDVQTNSQSNVQVDAQAAEFINGPYLLAPKTDGMVVSWESTTSGESKLYYGVDESSMQEIAVPVEEGEAYKDVPLHMFRGRLTGLTPATKYQYRVELPGGKTESGTFRTLPENPEEVRFITVSDTHKFETSQQVGEVITQFDPDFILHTGDTVEGTGTQKEQFSFWFQNDGNFLRNYPVIYCYGNHDYGPYFGEYVTKVQEEQYASNENGHNVSFDCGKVHITMVDSNPWGLLQMNVESSGGKMDEATQKLVDESLSWLKADLSSAAAQAADFRILAMHHPYQDDYTKRYIPPIAEANHVNLMLSGHLHTYNRGASADPVVGAQTLYVTQGDARIGDGKVDTGKEGQRVDENLPEILAVGKGDLLKVTVRDGLLTYENLGLKDGKEEAYETITLTKEAPQLSYSDCSITPDSVLSNGTVTVTATVTNAGKGLAAGALKITDNGEDRYLYLFGEKGKERVEAIGPGESKVLTGELPLSALGAHTLKLGDLEKSVDVQFRKATYTYSNLRVRMGTGQVSDPGSNLLCAKADVTNIGNEAGTADVPFLIGNQTESTQQIQLEAGETKTVEFQHTFDKYGTYAINVGDAGERQIEIEGIIQGTPIVKDLSGLGNDGIIRGAPVLVKHDGGYGLSLDGKKDYVEIPDRQNYVVDDGVTGMVWASIDRLAEEGEWDHNPLLMKGASISYGTNYLYRMAVRTTGKLTYGIGFDDDNGEFFWNDNDDAKYGAQLGKWTQYTGSFDRKTGGNSYQNTVESGQIDPPAFDSPIKNWEGRSMYAGFSFHRHLLAQRDRGKTHTMLTGDIGQIRFYNTKLSADENKQIYDAPTQKGPQGEKLVVWLDFDPKNIVTTGTHTTDWAPVTGEKLQSLAYDVSIPGASALKATIELSDDGKTARESKELTLKDGTGSIDLSALPNAKYARITTGFTSVLGEQETAVPALREYTLHFSDGSTKWATLADWNKGSYQDAVGYQPVDVFKDYAVDFDKYD